MGGLTPAPVVAVPTSAGYGASLEGVTALLAMLASCAPGVCVVGIDNGFGAAWAVARILGKHSQGLDGGARDAANDEAANGNAATGKAATGKAVTDDDGALVAH